MVDGAGRVIEHVGTGVIDHQHHVDNGMLDRLEKSRAADRTAPAPWRNSPWSASCHSAGAAHVGRNHGQDGRVGRIQGCGATVAGRGCDPVGADLQLRP